MGPSNGALSQGMDKVWDTGDRLGKECVLTGGLQINLPSRLLSQGMARVLDTGDRVGQEGCVDWGPVNGPL